MMTMTAMAGREFDYGHPEEVDPVWLHSDFSSAKTHSHSG